MSLFSRFSKAITERVLIVSIGSSTVTGSIVTFGGAQPLIESVFETKIEVLPELSLAEFENEMSKTLTTTLAGLRKGSSPDRIIVYLASPWYASQVRIAKMSRDLPFVISKTLVNDMISRELKAFSDEEMGEGRSGADAIRGIESKTMQVKLNGYITDNPIGVSARDLELSVFIAVAPEDVLKKIEDTIANEFPHRKITFASLIGASFIVVRDRFPHTGEYILVDVGGEVTDVSLIKDGNLMQTVSFAHGRNFILRRLSKGLGRSIQESVTICTLYVEGKVEESIKDKCEEILKATKDEWLDAFQKSLFSISNELSIPDTVLLLCADDVSPWFIETIRREEFHQYTLTEKEFKVVVLNAQHFHEALTFTEGTPRDPFIMIEALANSRHKEIVDSK